MIRDRLGRVLLVGDLVLRVETGELFLLTAIGPWCNAGDDGRADCVGFMVDSGVSPCFIGAQCLVGCLRVSNMGAVEVIGHHDLGEGG